MTDKASPDQPGSGARGQPEKKPAEGADTARFLQDWTALWNRELQAQETDAKAGDMSAAAEVWRTAMSGWTDALGTHATGALSAMPFAAALTGDRAGAPRT